MTESPERQRPIGFWLKLVDGLIDTSFEEVLATEQVSRRHWQVLNTVETAAGITPAELDARLAPFLTASEPTVGPVVADLLARGWLELGTDTDQKTDAVRISDAGREAQARLGDAVAATRQRLTEGLTVDQYAATVGVLRQMAVNLGWTQA